MKKMMTVVMGLLFITNVSATTFMSAEWAENLCDTWNENDALMTQLGGNFIHNNGGRGFKMLILNRMDCDMPDIQITLEEEDGMAICVDSGLVAEAPNFAYDYRMRAKTRHWAEMGRGAYGPMRAMLRGKLKFQGPKKESMKYIKPFGNFLRLIGEVEGDQTSCQ